jgi:hypothetical protein
MPGALGNATGHGRGIGKVGRPVPPHLAKMRVI